MPPKNDYLSQLTLGKKTDYKTEYDATLLQAVPRQMQRSTLPCTNEPLPFTHGVDVWTLYELSWLNQNGIPQVAIGEVEVDQASINLIESKSFKLYLNSFNQSQFESIDAVKQHLINDLSACAQGHVNVNLRTLDSYHDEKIATFDGICIDHQDIKIEHYNYTPSLLENSVSENEMVTETLVSHVLKSNCLITSQPDWGSIQIKYTGRKIDQTALLRYLISFRQHNEFHEHCVERIFCDLMHYAKPHLLQVYARYTRRGGLDINPCRANYKLSIDTARLARQ